MDTRTRHALKQDSFAKATASSFDWISGHRSGVLRWVVSVVAAVVLCIAGLWYWNMRVDAADSALGAAMDTYGAQSGHARRAAADRRLCHRERALEGRP